MWTLPDSYETSAGHVAARRTGNGPPLVLAHGWPWSSFAWSRVASVLAEHFTLYIYDMPGFGRSEMRQGQATGLDMQGQVFCEMLDQWNLASPSVIAHDFGGAVSLRAHLLHGHDFSQLILMNVVALSPWGSEFFDHVGRHVDAFTGLPDHIHRAVAEAYIRGAFAHPIAEEDISALLAPWLSTAGRHSFYAQFAQANEAYTDEFKPLLGNMRCPVSVLWGKDDPWIPIDRGHALANLLGVPLTPLDGLGHLPQLEAPHRVAIALLNSLHSSTIQRSA